MVDDYEAETGIDLYQTDDTVSIEDIALSTTKLCGATPQNPQHISTTVNNTKDTHWEVFYDKDGILQAVCKE